MPDSINPGRRSSSPHARSFALTTLASAALLAGCGAGSHRPTAPRVSGSGTPASHRTGTAPTVSTGSSRTTGTSTPTRSRAGGSGPLAFSNCMRSNGVPSFPDPSPGGGFDLRSVPGLSPSSPAFRAAQAKCGGLIPGPLSSSNVSPQLREQTLTKLREIAVCMRAHHVSEFPDPSATPPAHPPAGAQEITNYDGVFLVFPDTLNLQAPAYRQDLAACGAPPLGLPHHGQG